MGFVTRQIVGTVLFCAVCGPITWDSVQMCKCIEVWNTLHLDNFTNLESAPIVEVIFCCFVYPLWLQGSCAKVTGKWWVFVVTCASGSCAVQMKN